MSTGIYTTINPETGELTKDNEFQNSWKWGNTKTEDFKSPNQAQRANCENLRIPRDTPPIAINELIKFKKKAEHHESHYIVEVRKNSEYLRVIENASIENKQLKEQEKKAIKINKDFLKEISSYLFHKEDCTVTIMNVIGRAKTNSKCNCGLSKILSGKAERLR